MRDEMHTVTVHKGTARVELFRDYGGFKEFIEARKGPFQIFMADQSPTGGSWWAIVVVPGSP